MDQALDDALGQLVVVGFRGMSAADACPAFHDAVTLGLGGVILFDRDVTGGTGLRNVADPEQLRHLTDDLRRRMPGPRPWVMVDQEGGRVARLPRERGFPAAPAAVDLGATSDVEATAAAATGTARGLAMAGVDFNLAPVVDLDWGGASPAIGALGRSFGADPDRVIRHARAVIAAHRAGGIATAIKHFPGHGSARGDTHAGLVDITDTWSDRELLPYRRLIGDGDVDAVLIGHLMHRELDETWPASLSVNTVNGLLRQELGFKGVVITDDLQMNAVRRLYDLDTVVTRALLGGADVLLFGNNLVYEPDMGRRAVRAIRNAIDTGRVPEDRVRQALDRIAVLKDRYP